MLAGTRLGPYEVLTPLGQGGMGEVYRARDTRLDRAVAIKIISSEIAQDPASRHRLIAEARAASLLNHPNICALYDVGSHQEIDFLVMELLQGETLAQRLHRGALPFDAVVRVGTEIAQALDAAHGQGVVHRDLKPGNVMLTRVGAKLLDFGVALTGRPAPAGPIGARPLGSSVESTGAVPGTPPYMAPEQIDGQDVDFRADVFAFGSVLYEMATGRKAFDGASQTGLAVAIREQDPTPPSAIQSGVPPAFDRLVARCLAKDPEERWQSVRDILFQLGAIEAGDPAEGAVTPRSRAIAIGIAGALAAAALVVAGAALRQQESPVAAGTFHISLPPGARLEPPEAVSSLALTRDGRQLAFVAAHEGRNRLWVRPLSSQDARPLDGTENARMPFWAPDGRSLGFFAAGQLLRIDPDGGPPQLICNASVDTAPTWGPDDTILFAQAPDAAQQRSGGVYRVSAAGGPVTQVTVVDPAKGESEHYWPSFLPDGVHFLYVATIADEGETRRRHTAFVGSIADAAVTRIGDIDSRVVYSPSGHLLYGQDGALLARRFDLHSYRMEGDPMTVADRLWYYKATGLAQFAISDNGVLAYHGGPTVSELVWFDRSGRQIGAMGPRASYEDVRISSSGRAVAVAVIDPRTGMADISIFDRETGIPTRFTSDPGGATRPVWSADGNLLFFRLAGAQGPPDIYQKRSDGRGGHELRLALDGVQQPMDASQDGRYLVYSDANRATIRDIWLLPLTPQGVPRPYLRTPSVEQDARIAPNSRWVAFMSSETGKAEVYVAPIDDPGARRRVSADGGVGPRWRQDGRQLIYVDLNDTLMAVDLVDGPDLKAGRPQPLFAAGRLSRNPGAGFGEPYYDLAPDGQSFLVNRIVHDAAGEPITVVLDWPSVLAN